MDLPLRDLEKEHPIPSFWKDEISSIVIQLTKGNFELLGTSSNVSLQSSDLADLNRQNVDDYGCCLIPLREECWERSCYQWQGEYLDLIVDLCTSEEGVSDLILSGRVYPLNSGFNYEVGLIYVP